MDEILIEIGELTWLRAKARFDKTQHPRIQLYQKTIDLPQGQSKRDADSRFDFLTFLKDKEHFPDTFENEDALVNELNDAIDSLLAEDNSVEQLRFD